MRPPKRDIQDELVVKSGIELLKGKWQEVDGKYVLPITGSFEQRAEAAADMRRALEHLDIMTRRDLAFTNDQPNTSLPVHITADDANGNNQLVMSPEKYKQLQDALKFIAQINTR